MLQVALDLRTRHLHHKELVFIGIDGEQIVVLENAGVHVSIEGERGAEGDLGGLAAQAEGVDEVHVIAHAPVGVAGPEIRVQDAHFLEREGLDGLVVLLEEGLHVGINHLRPHRDGECLVGPGDHLTALEGQLQLPLGDIAAVAAGIEEDALRRRLHIGPMVVARQDEIDTLHQAEGVQALGLQLAAVARSRPGMHHHHHHVRMLLGLDTVHIGLDHVHDGHEVHPAPEFLREPRLHVRVRIAQYGHFQARLPDDLVGLEIRLAIVIPDGVGRQEVDAGLLQVRRHAVIHRMPRLDIVVAHGDGVIAHVLRHPRKKVRSDRIDIVEVIGRVVPLQAVTCVDKEHILSPVRRTDAVHIMLHRHQRRTRPVVHIRRIEPRTMHIVGGKHGQCILTVLGAASAGHREQRHRRHHQILSDFHKHRLF